MRIYFILTKTTYMITWEKVLQIITDAGLRILFAAVLLIVGFFVIKYLVKLITKFKGFKRLDVSLQSFLKSFISIILKILLIISAIGVLGVPLTSVLTVLASAGLAIGPALQGALSNLAGGFMILIFKPFRTGDYIDNGTHQGTVESITTFYTKLLTFDNKLITIPNKSIIETAITNFSAQDERRIDVKFRASFETDIDTVKRIILDVAYNHELTLKKPLPLVTISSYLENSLEYFLRVWVKKADYWTVYFDIMEQVKKRFDQEGIAIPYQQVDVHIKEK